MAHARLTPSGAPRNTPRYRITPSIDVLPILSFGLHVMSVPSVHPSGRSFAATSPPTRRPTVFSHEFIAPAPLQYVSSSALNLVS